MSLTRRSAIAGAAATGGALAFRGAFEAALASPELQSLRGLSVPSADLVGAYGVIRINHWAGNSARIVRPSDDGSLDVSFNDRGFLDSAATDRFAGTGGESRCSVWYDQSGNNNDLSQPAGVNQPICAPTSDWRGIRPISACGFPYSAAQWLQGAGTFNIDTHNSTVYMVLAPRVSYSACGYLDASDADAKLSYLSLRQNRSPVSLQENDRSLSSAMLLRSQITTLSFSSMRSNVKWRVNGVESSRDAPINQNNIRNILLGKAVSDSAYNGRQDYFCVLLYAQSHTASEMRTIEMAFQSAFSVPTKFENRIVYGGSSLIDGWFATRNLTAPWVAGFGRDLAHGGMEGWEVYNFGVGGQTSAAEYANRAIYAAMYDATKAKNICVIDAPSNDVEHGAYEDQKAAEAAADALYERTVRPLATALKAYGFAGVVMPTIIPRGGFTTENFREQARLRYNDRVTSGSGYVISDRCDDPHFGTQAACRDGVYYAPDQIHCTDAGYAILARIDLAAIKTI